ncbi:MAG: response regulator [Candidatus Electryoneaceae bacterium]|nr:response regulator [Candidatus Electryoneaceae bacterium]
MKKILVVDDKSVVRELVKVTLQSDNREIFEAASGEEAVEIAKRILPELVLMDVMMPLAKVDGFEATRIIKSDPNLKNTVIIMLTALGQQYDLDKGHKVGADDYFTKPFSPLELLKTVEKFIG